ncbi:MAG: glycosyltransferase [Candidatus Syntrophoarchaeum butanivorans]|uniref:Glycosyltransferase n=1 Tax=Candidatus Syntropharchaeum butanivorans TaxID=1839936 RepID=A0A1F2P3R1_9EURY|nr:MAG: glycosyltransferase [Candidatus Syntrophoarchaeum butanivorans]
MEIVAVVDGNRELYERITGDGVEVDRIILNRENLGLSASRNRGIKEANGDIIAFFDDDAIADREWVEELVRTYEERGAMAVGGRILPLWVAEKPRFLPEECYWLIGATYRGFPEEMTEVRNTFGSNISFKADVIRELGGFKREMGVRGKYLLQGEETELCERMRARFGCGIIYNPDAVVYHKVFAERLKIGFLLRRSFWQGYSKWMMKKMGYSVKEESGFLRYLLLKSTIEKLKKAKLMELAFIVICTSVVGLGYLSGFFTSNR